MTLIHRDKKTGAKLYQCGAREIPAYLRSKPIDLLVLSAKEYQPKITKVPQVIHVPYADKALMSNQELQSILDKAMGASAATVDALASGKNALVTCWAGLNRSGLISGMSLIDLYGCSGDQAIDLIQSRRKRALFNPLFRKILRCY